MRLAFGRALHEGTLRPMSASGQKLGSYEVLAKLGEGGMGIVYLARDPRLNRQVAIKVLPPHVAGDSESLARFRREATLLAALNHPNIAAIHSTEESDGQQLLVLEYVPGPTLADVLADPSRTTNGRLPLDQTLAIASQIASALEAAHEQGIVHRDLKPANIKVRDDGTVKVLDFGLAKVTSGASEATDLSQAGTMTSPAMTQMGVILGTAAYMSPEQARGKPVDKRADLWAFGVVLYEMLSGERMFGGETITDVIASVVTREPDWNKLPAETPEPIRRLLRRCLQKEPRRRLRDASDARFEIEDAQSPTDEKPTHSALTPQVQPASRRMPFLIAGAIGAVAIAGALGYVFGSSKPETSSPLRRMLVTVPGPPVVDALSPDGAWLVGRYDNRLYVRRLDQPDWRELPGTRGAHYSLFWSSDSRYIAFPVGAALKKVDVDGARATTICETCLVPELTRGGAWNADGTIVVGGAGGLKKISLTGETTELTKLNGARGESSHRYPAFLPDERRFLFTVRRDNGEHEIQLGSLDGGEPRVVMPGFSRLVYRNGYLLFARGNTLLAQPFDPATGTSSGTPATIATNLRNTVTVAEGFFGAGSDGTLVYAIARSFTGAVWVGRDGRQSAVAMSEEIDDTQRVSPDGRKMAAAVHDHDKASTDIVVIELASGARSRLTSHPLWDQNPVWSPDSSQIAYRSGKDGSGVYILDAAGGNERRLTTGDDMWPLDWSADGKILATRVAANATDLILIPVSGGAPVRVAATTNANGVARFSPDGKLVAHESLESGSLQIHVRGIDSPLNVRVTTTGGTSPVWSHDGTELYYIDPDKWIVAVAVRRAGAGVDFGPPKQLFPRGLPGSMTAAFDVDASGRFLMRRVEDKTIVGEGTILNVIQNWTKLIGRPSP